MDLSELQRHWDAFGRQDPFWAILTDPARRGNRWSPGEFFETGRVEVADLLAHGERLGVPHRFHRALDFGCGAGRLTQALAGRFERAVGVDVAPSMIALARQHNQFGERCQYEVNDRPDLTAWPDASFDLIYTSRVLQHIEPRYSTSYIREFVRLLAPGGYLSFDVPSASGDAVAVADGSVPASAMRAQLVVAPAGPVSAAPGQRVGFRVRVTNLSGVVWQDTVGRDLNLGNHWLDATGTLLQQDDVRVKLPTPLAPAASATVDAVITAPFAPGRYQLQFDVVQEGVAWFSGCGSQAAEVSLIVAADLDEAARTVPGAVPDTTPPARQTSRADADDPVMEMHAVPREEVEAILHDAGARPLDVRRVHHCGPMWLAFRYDVTR